MLVMVDSLQMLVSIIGQSCFEAGSPEPERIRAFTVLSSYWGCSKCCIIINCLCMQFNDLWDQPEVFQVDGGSFTQIEVKRF